MAVSLAMFTRSAQGFQVTKKGIELQMNCALEQISTGTSACSRSARNLAHWGETDHVECFDYWSKSPTRDAEWTPV